MESNEKENRYAVLSIALTRRQDMNQLLQFLVFIIGVTLSLVCCVLGDILSPKAFAYTAYASAMAFTGAGLCNFFIAQIGLYLNFKSDNELLIYERARKKHSNNSFFVGASNLILIVIMLSLNVYSLSNFGFTPFTISGSICLVVSILMFVASNPLGGSGWINVLETPKD